MKTEKTRRDERSAPGTGGSRQPLSPTVVDVVDEAMTHFGAAETPMLVKVQQ
jgi:hypothetical protein|tara:strand:- start:64 stop:219 length:156 start_codon:yes stop_codon:yes gene_type:complete